MCSSTFFCKYSYFLNLCLTSNYKYLVFSVFLTINTSWSWHLEVWLLFIAIAHMPEEQWAFPCYQLNSFLVEEYIYNYKLHWSYSITFPGFSWKILIYLNCEKQLPLTIKNNRMFKSWSRWEPPRLSGMVFRTTGCLAWSLEPLSPHLNGNYTQKSQQHLLASPLCKNKRVHKLINFTYRPTAARVILQILSNVNQFSCCL